MTPPLKTTVMMKKLILALLFSFIYLNIPAQEWNIHYSGDYPEGCTHFHDGFIDEDGVTFLAGQAGSDTDTPEAIFMRIEPGKNESELRLL